MAAPQTIWQRRAGMVSSLSTPPSAQGEHVHLSQHGALGIAPVGVGQLFCQGALGLVDVGDDQLGALVAQRPGECLADGPDPTTATVRPSKLSEPKRLMTHARMAASTPAAVNGLGSPTRPSRAGARRRVAFGCG